IRPDRQILYWSATWPKDVESLARQFLRNPYKVTNMHPFQTLQVIIGSPVLKVNQSINQAHQAALGNDGWNQNFYLCGNKERMMKGMVLAVFRCGRSLILSAIDFSFLVGFRIVVALQLSVQEGAKDQSCQADMRKLLADQSFVSSILSSLPGVDPNDPSVKYLLASMQNQPEKDEDQKEDDK
ncbi:hypothetical protein Tco_0530719, partial [Tanacetum coccineum]